VSARSILLTKKKMLVFRGGGESWAPPMSAIGVRKRASGSGAGDLFQMLSFLSEPIFILSLESAPRGKSKLGKVSFAWERARAKKSNIKGRLGRVMGDREERALAQRGSRSN